MGAQAPSHNLRPPYRLTSDFLYLMQWRLATEEFRTISKLKETVYGFAWTRLERDLDAPSFSLPRS
jgi:hypothetical protein